MKPLLLINFKTYKEGTGEEALELTKIADKIAKKTKAKIVVALQPTDIEKIAKVVSIDVYAQHVDAIDYGSNTGWILPEAVKEAGVKGTLINHSEHKLKPEQIKACVERAKAINLITVCCAKDPEEAEKAAKFSPNYIAYEPPELIGTGIPVSKTKPEVVKKAVEVVRKVNSEIKVLCGAGISTGKDVKIALQLGTKGVLVASAIVKAKNPAKIIKDMVKNLDYA